MSDINDYGDQIVALEAVMPPAMSAFVQPRMPLQPIAGQLTAKSLAAQPSPKKVKYENTPPTLDRQQLGSITPVDRSTTSPVPQTYKKTPTPGDGHHTIASIEYKNEKMAYIVKHRQNDKTYGKLLSPMLVKPD